MSNGIKVKKRNGRGIEPLDLEKIHNMVEMACESLAGVSASQVEIQSGIQFYDGMTTADIQEILCLLYTSPSPRDRTRSRMPSSA